MATGEVVGSVAELWCFPVKSMRGEKLPETEITPRGVLGDRAYALIDNRRGAATSASAHPLPWPRTFDNWLSAGTRTHPGQSERVGSGS
jgi:uncharacterized protein